jgi:hypothetical protein
MAPPILVLITPTSGRCDVAYWPLADALASGSVVRFQE